MGEAVLYAASIEFGYANVLASTAFVYTKARLLVAMPLIPRRTAKRKEVISNG